MNQPFQSDPAQNQMQPEAQPQPQVLPQPTQPLSSPFEQAQQTDPNAYGQPPSVPMPGQMDQMGQVPAPQEPQPMQNDMSMNGGAPVENKPKSSFWLIIALVVILFIGILIFVSWEGWINLGSISNIWKRNTPATTTKTPTVSQATADDNIRKSDLTNLKSALKSYYQANQNYPVSASSQKTSDSNSVLSVLLPTYIAALPDDPLSPTYYYGYTSDGKTFTLTAVLEDNADTAGKINGSVNLYSVTDASAETPTTSTNTTTTSTDTTTTTIGTPTDTNTSTSSGTSASSSATAGQ